MTAMPPSPLWGEGLTGAFYRLPPSGGKLSSEARLMRGLTTEHRADEDIRPYNTSIRSSYPVGAAPCGGPQSVGRDDPARRLKFAFCPSRGPDFRRRTGDVSPPGEVLSMDGKYPKILGPAGPNPGRTFRPCPKFVRRGRELGAAASSARCRSHLSNSRFPSFPPRASRVPCLSVSIW